MPRSTKITPRPVSAPDLCGNAPRMPCPATKVSQLGTVQRISVARRHFKLARGIRSRVGVPSDEQKSGKNPLPKPAQPKISRRHGDIKYNAGLSPPELLQSQGRGWG